MEHLVLSAQGPVDGTMGMGGVGVHGRNHHHPEYARPYDDEIRWTTDSMAGC